MYLCHLIIRFTTLTIKIHCSAVRSTAMRLRLIGGTWGNSSGIYLANKEEETSVFLFQRKKWCRIADEKDP